MPGARVSDIRGPCSEMMVSIRANMIRNMIGGGPIVPFSSSPSTSSSVARELAHQSPFSDSRSFRRPETTPISCRQPSQTRHCWAAIPSDPPPLQRACRIVKCSV